MNYLYKEDKREEFDYYWNKDYIKLDSLCAEMVSRGIIMPLGRGVSAGVYNDDRKYVPTSSERLVDLSQDSLPIDMEYDYIDDEVVYMGAFSTGHYGDFLIDDLSRLWYIIQQDSTKKLAYVSKRLDIANTEWCIRILSHLGITSDQLIRVTKPTCFRNVIVPQKSMVHDAYIHPIYLDIYEKIWQSCRQICCEWGGGKAYVLNSQIFRTKKGDRRIYI